MLATLRVAAKYLAELGRYVGTLAGDTAEIRVMLEEQGQKLAAMDGKIDQIVRALGPHIDEQRAFRAHVEESIDRHGKRLRALENGKRVDEAR